jgi:hypothetical protein
VIGKDDLAQGIDASKLLELPVDEKVVLGVLGRIPSGRDR